MGAGAAPSSLVEPGRGAVYRTSGLGCTHLLDGTGACDAADVTEGQPIAKREAEPASQLLPIIFVVSEDRSVLAELDEDLSRRFGCDFRIVTAASAPAGLAALRTLTSSAAPVALLIADQRLAGPTGIEFLGLAHRLHPTAKRVVLTERDYTTANPIVPAMMVGQVDYHLVHPWIPDRLFPAVSEFLGSWERSKSDGFTIFRVVAPENSGRAHEIRDLLTRVSTPYTSDSGDSPNGAALLRDAGHEGTQLPVVIRHDGLVLVDPTNAELVEAMGGVTRLGTGVYDVAIVGAGPAGLS